MFLILVRHGEAVPDHVDPSRPLSARGREEAQRTAGFLKQHGVSAQFFYHSGKKRAQETASIIHRITDSRAAFEQKDYLAPDDPLDGILKEITRLNKDLLIAGHMPFLSRLVSQLVVNDENQPLVAIPTGGMVILEKEKTQWVIREVVDPKFL